MAKSLRKVMPWDPMPHVVCHKCIEKLNLFNDFYEASLKAERYLRTLNPSDPGSDLEDLNRVVDVIDTPILTKSALKLPPKKRQGLSPSPLKTKKDSSPEFLDVSDHHQSEIFPKRTLNCFIINQITSRDSVFTCRECYRTFTKQSSALTHSCVRIEDCAEVETIDVEDEEEKSLPPLKIRLFSMRSGVFVCYLCQAPFEEKTDMIEHIKRHILDENWEEGKKGGGGKQKGKRKGRGCPDESDEEDEWKDGCKKKAVRRKRKKCSGPPKKRGRPRSGENLDYCQSGTCAKCGQCQHSSTTTNLSEKKTMERTTQYSDMSENSEEEAEKKGEHSPVILNPNTKTPPRCVDNANYVVTPEKTDHSNSLSPCRADKSRTSIEDSEDLIEIPKISDIDTISDEVTVLQVINNKTPTMFSSCVFCDKIFATKEALITHQNKHLQGMSLLKSETEEKKLKEVTPVSQLEEETFLCSICAMIFTNKKTLLDHEQFHLVDMEALGCQRKIRIALGNEFSDREVEQECQISKGRGVITITVTAGEKKIPQIEFI